MEERDPVLERNFIIFMVLAMLIIFGWMFFLGKQKPAPKPETKEPAQLEEKQDLEKPVPEPSQIAEPRPKPELATKKGAVLPTTQVKEKEVLVKNELYSIRFTNQGAVPVSWELKPYKDKVYFPYEISLRWPPFKKIPRFESNPAQLINPMLGQKLPLQCKIQLNQFEIPEQALWKVGTDKIIVSSQPEQLVFTMPLSPQVSLEKIYKFYPGEFRVELEIKFKGIEPDPKLTQVNFGLNFILEPLDRLSRINFHGPLYHTPQKLVRVQTKELDKKKQVSEAISDWAGFTDSYFLTALLTSPDAPFSVKTYYAGDEQALQAKDRAKEYALEISQAPNARLISEGALTRLEIYFGPKEKEILQKVRGTLGLAIDYGFFAPLAIPLVYALKWTNKLVHNYGWSIVILTIILRMAMFPLTRKGQQSMKELQKLQPEMEKIRKKYAEDRAKQQEELYALYRKYKINPMGGCLPMLIQIPIFFAFYKVLLVSIELRHAPWLLWIQDLSARDPLLILPVIMGISQFVMQKLTPTTLDPNQAKILMFMPLFFTVLLVYFPSGLLLYWTVSNIIGIAQQIYVNKTTK